MTYILLILILLFSFSAHAQNMTPGDDPGGVTSPGGTGTTYYVSWSDGNDNDDGLSEANAWKTTTKVRNFLFAAGDTILFKRGDTWTGSVFRVRRSGVSGNPITFGAYSTGNRPKLQDYNDSSGNEFMWNVQWIVIDRLHFDSGDPIKLRTVGNIIFQNSEVSFSSRTCLRVYDDSFNVTVQNNKIWDCGGYAAGNCGLDCGDPNGEGLYIGSAQSFDPSDFTKDVTLKSNEVFNTTDNWIDIKEKLVNIIVENNILHTSIQNPLLQGGIIMGQGTGNGSTGCRISRNVMHTFKGDAAITPARDTRVVNNIIYNIIEGSGIRIRNTVSGNYYHNTIYGILEGGKVPIQIDSGASGYDIKNNIGPGTANNIATASNLFVDAAGGNFQLVGGSAALNAGSVVGNVTTDILGVIRPQPLGGATDYGAYETTVASVPSVPLNLRAVSSVAGINITLAWDASETGTPTSYKVYWDTTPATYGNNQSAGLALTDSVDGLTLGTTYYFTVAALNATGEGAKSNEIQVLATAPLPGDPTRLMLHRSAR